MLSVYAIQWPLTLLATSLDYFWLFLTKIALAASALVLQVDSLPNTLVVLIAASCLVLMLPFSSRLKIISAFACLIIFFPPLQTKPEKDQFTLHLLDVGQGLSIFIETHTRNILFDTGAGYASGFNYFNAIIQPLLSKIKVHKLDLMVISHSDNDHSGGLLAAQSALKIARLDSEIAGDGSVVNKPCESNLAWQWDGVSFHYRHPDVSSEKKINNRSCVLEISTQQCKVLIMADAEKKIEALLIPTNIQANQQVLIVGHHGSNTSTSKDFLQREAFTSALISNGYKNRYGHPHPSVLKRLHQAEVEIYRTDVLGSIEVTAGVSGCDISSYKQKNKRYWW
jgi:competence protein ComEC